MAEAEDFGIVPAAQPSPTGAGGDDFGIVSAEPAKQPDMSAAAKALSANVDEARAEYIKSKNPEQHEARTFTDDWMAGWGQSVTSLGLTNQKMPDTVLPEHADRLAKIIAGAGQFAGDAPAALAGFVGGSALGGRLGAKGAAAGAMAGAFAVPAGLRQILMDHYRKGDIQDFNDFYNRASSTLLTTLKAGVTGAAVGLTGNLVGGALPTAISPLLKAGAMTAADAATMTTVGAAMEGKPPNLSDFVDNAAFMGLMHGLTSSVEPVKSKLMDVYAKTGLHPTEVTSTAMKDPVLRQELLSKDPGIPNSLTNLIDPKADVPNNITINMNPEFAGKKLDGISSLEQPEGKWQVEAPAEAKQNPGEEIQRSENVNNVLAKIGEQPEAPKEKLNFKKFYTAVLDKNDPIKNMTLALQGKEALGAKDDPYGLMRSFGSAPRKADLAIEQGPYKFDPDENGKFVKTGTPGLKDTWEKADDMQELRAYQLSKHALDLEAQGKQIPISHEDAEATVKELGPKYAGIAKDETKFGNDMIDYLADSGVISKDGAGDMKEKYQNYISMKRVKDLETPQNRGPGKGYVPSNPLKAMSEEGSEEKIINPTISRIKDTHAIVAMAERNRVMGAMGKMVEEANGRGDYSFGTVEGLTSKQEKAALKESSTSLQQQGFSKQEADYFSDISTLTKPDTGPLKDDQVSYFKDGKRMIINGVPKDIVAAVRGMDSSAANLFIKAISSPSKLLREGMLTDPRFGIRHEIRQEGINLLTAPDFRVPGYNVLAGLSGMFGDSKEEFGQYIMSGGGSDSIGSIDKNYIQSKIWDLNDKTGFLDSAWNKVKNYAQFSKHTVELLDNARTFQKYRNRLNSGEVSDQFQAQFQARDSGIDINRSGAQMTAYSMLDPFQNIRIQGLDLIARQIKENPGQFSAKLLATVGLPSALLWFSNHDKDWYKALTQQDRDMNYHFAVGDPDHGWGHVFRIPKPFEPGQVGSLVERTLDAFYAHSPHAFEAFGKTIKDAVLPGYVPTFAQPAIEAYANKSTLTDSPLIPHKVEGVNPQYQSNAYTSTTAKVVASGLRLIPLDITQKPGTLASPAIVDNFIKSWTGGAGQLVLSATDKALEANWGKDKTSLADVLGVDYNKYPPTSVWSDNPFLRAFVLRYPSTNTSSIEKFFTRYDETDRQLKTITYLRNNYDFQDMQKEQLKAASDGEMFRLSGYKKTISDQMAEIHKITVMPKMDPDQKRQAIDAWAKSVNQTATNANAAMDAIEKNVQELKRKK